MTDALPPDRLTDECVTCSGRGVWMDELCTDCVRPIEQEFAVVIAALLAGRIDGSQAITSAAAIHEHIVAARVAAARAEERERWIEHLSPLCDDEWLRRRDRAMELPGVRGHRWERRASSAWEQAANGVRSVLNDLANYSDEYSNRHAAYLHWMNGGRDEARADTPAPSEADQ